MTSYKVDVSLIQNVINIIPPDFTIKTNNGSHKCHRLLAATFSRLIETHLRLYPDSSEIDLDFPDPLNQFPLVVKLFHGEEIIIDDENIFFLSAIASKLRFSRLTNKIRHIGQEPGQPQPIEYDDSDPLNGVFCYLKQVSLNFYDTLEISASSSSSYGNPRNVVSQEINSGFWESIDSKPNPYIQFKLNNLKLNLVSYVLQSTENASDNRDPISWIVAGSNDGENWETLDQVDNKSDLCGRDSIAEFDCSCKETETPFSIIRFEMTEPNYRGDWTFRLANVELYGDLYEGVSSINQDNSAQVTQEQIEQNSNEITNENTNEPVYESSNETPNDAQNEEISKEENDESMKDAPTESQDNNNDLQNEAQDDNQNETPQEIQNETNSNEQTEKQDEEENETNSNEQTEKQDEEQKETQNEEPTENKEEQNGVKSELPDETVTSAQIAEPSDAPKQENDETQNDIPNEASKDEQTTETTESSKENQNELKSDEPNETSKDEQTTETSSAPMDEQNESKNEEPIEASKDEQIPEPSEETTEGQNEQELSDNFDMPLKPDEPNTFLYNEKQPFRGVFFYIKRNSSELSELLEINTSSSSTYGDPLNVISHDNFADYWESDDSKADPYIQFNFNNIKLNLAGYVLQSPGNISDDRNPTSWIVGGSNDEENWETLDQIDGTNCLRDKGSLMAFECNSKETNEPYKFIRFQMTEPNERGDWTFRLANVELYGDIYLD